jgi:hypothetical protein
LCQKANENDLEEDEDSLGFVISDEDEEFEEEWNVQKRQRTNTRDEKPSEEERHRRFSLFNDGTEEEDSDDDGVGDHQARGDRKATKKEARDGGRYVQAPRQIPVYDCQVQYADFLQEEVASKIEEGDSSNCS